MQGTAYPQYFLVPRLSACRKSSIDSPVLTRIKEAPDVEKGQKKAEILTSAPVTRKHHRLLTDVTDVEP